MQRLYFLFSIHILAALLVSCAPKAVLKSEEVNVLEEPTPTNLPDRVASQPADTTKSETVSKDPPVDCPITTPPQPAFIPPSLYAPNGPFPEWFWYGSNSLWTAIPQTGIWSGLPYDSHGYTQKVFWWREGYVWTEEPQPDLVVTGERLDAPAPPLNVSEATNAYASDIGSAMLLGVDFPTPGCWKITGHYRDSELSFVVWVAP